MNAQSHSPRKSTRSIVDFWRASVVVHDLYGLSWFQVAKAWRGAWLSPNRGKWCTLSQRYKTLYSEFFTVAAVQWYRSQKDARQSCD